MKRFLSHCRFALFLSLIILRSGLCEDLQAVDLLPAETVLYASIGDSADLAERLQQTAVGQLLRDEQVRPLYEHMYGSMTPVLEQVEERLGMTVEDLLKIPDGELAFALVAIPGAPPAAVVLLESGLQKSIDGLLEQGRTALVEGGFTPAEEDCEGVTLRVYSRSGQPISEIIQLQLDKKVVIATNLELAKQLVGKWKQTSDQATLRSVENFQSVMAHCQAGSGPSQMKVYVDPIGLVRALTRGNPAAAAGLALLPAIGLDGLLGVGVSLQLAEGDFDNLMHAHILLDQPRDGALDLIALTSGPTQPETWVPADTTNYATWHWDLRQTIDTVRELLDSFRGEGATDRFLQQRLSEPLGIDVQKDLLPAMTGRFSRLVWFERPVTATSRALLLGVHLEDGAAFRPTLEKVTEKFAESLESSDFGGTKLYSVKQPEVSDPPDDPTDDSNRRPRRRRPGRPQLTMALVDNVLLLADRPSVIEQAILAQRDGVPRLRDELDYQLMADRLKRQVPSQAPGLLSFERPAEGLRVAYELLQSDEVRQRIHEQREQNAFLRAVDEALEQQKFPPFAVIARYLAPGGSLLINEETGLHYIRFTLRRQTTAP